jgi:hypothetical protein
LVWKDWTHNLGAKLLSLVVATALWFSVTNQQASHEDLVLPIVYKNMPPDLTPVDKLPEEVKVRVNSKGRFLGWRLRDAHLLVELSGSQIGRNPIPLRQGTLEYPKKVEVSSSFVLDPTIYVDFDETVIRDVPISPTIVGDLAPRHLQVGRTLVDPSHARVKGPRRRVDEIPLISTEEIDISGDKNTLRKRVRLERPEFQTVEVTPMTVEIGITIEPELTRTLESVALNVTDQLKKDWIAVFQPGALQVEITGAKSIVEAAEKEVSTVQLHGDSFSLGTSILRFKEVRGREIVYAPYETFPLVTAPPWGATTGPPPIGPMGPPGQKIPAAVRGEVIGTLPIPREMGVLKVEPERIVLKIREKGAHQELVRGPGLSP